MVIAVIHSQGSDTWVLPANELLVHLEAGRRLDAHVHLVGGRRLAEMKRRGRETSQDGSTGGGAGVPCFSVETDAEMEEFDLAFACN